MDALVYVLLWAGFFFLPDDAIGCGAHMMGHSHKHERSSPAETPGPDHRVVPPRENIDPVCGMKVDRDSHSTKFWAFPRRSAVGRRRSTASPNARIYQLNRKTDDLVRGAGFDVTRLFCGYGGDLANTHEGAAST
jgi:hypothetical protein